MSESIQVLAPPGCRLGHAGVKSSDTATNLAALQDPLAGSCQYPITPLANVQHSAAATAPPPVASATPLTQHVMKQVRRWLLWRYVPVPDSKPKKVPYYANGRARGDTDTPEDTAQLVSYEEACAVQHRYSGLGFALGDGWQGIDLDSVRDNQLHDIAKEVAGYVELSPSETGLHAIGYGRAFNNLASNASGIEAYCCKRYFTFTGNEQDDAPLTCLAHYVETVLAPRHALGKKKSSHGGRWNPDITLADIPDEPQVRTDREVWMAIQSAANYPAILALCNMPPLDGNSQLDASLMQHLVFHSPNNEQVLRLFFSAPLTQRKKAQARRDYVLNTLGFARYVRNAEREYALQEASALAATLADNPAFQAQVKLQERMRIAGEKAAARFAAKSA